MKISVPAIEFLQGKGRKHRMFCFVVDGKRISEFASVSRIRRGEDDSLIGYQRPEVMNHVREIRRYLDDADSPMIPNAIVVSFTDGVSFSPKSGTRGDAGGLVGELNISVNAGDASDRPGWIVDGQQRTAAIRDASLECFPVCVVAFVATDESEQREHFVRVNSAKPLPKDLIFELLPETNGPLPRQYLGRREAAKLASKLNSRKDSPFRRRIRMPTCPTGIVSYRAVLRMIESSYREGTLYDLGERFPASSETAALDFLVDYWTAVSETFQDAWMVLPTKSRLMHGCGIIAMGYLMDEVGHQVGIDVSGRQEKIRNELFKIRNRCAWTAGSWTFDDGTQIPWNGLQNTPRDIALLTNKILSEYRRTRDGKKLTNSIQ